MLHTYERVQEKRTQNRMNICDSALFEKPEQNSWRCSGFSFVLCTCEVQQKSRAAWSRDLCVSMEEFPSRFSIHPAQLT